jgi:hypothetical protein
VKQLAAKYDAWFADISHDGLKRFPIPVGHAEHNPVELHAPQAHADKPLIFANGPGFANDWLTGWTDVKAKVVFDLEVVTAGEYEIELSYCAPANTKLRLSADKQTLEASIPAASAPEIPLPHRDEAGKSRYRNREWTHLKLGTLYLKPGPTTLTLEALSLPGIDLKHLKLTRR